MKRAFESLEGWSDGIKDTADTSPEHYRAVFRWIQAAQRVRYSMPAGSAKIAGDLSRDKGAERSWERNGDESGRRQQQARAAGLWSSSGRRADGIGEGAGLTGSNGGQQAGSGSGTDAPRSSTTVKNSGCNPSRSSSGTDGRCGDGGGGHVNGLAGRSGISSARDCGGDASGCGGLCEAHLGFAGGDGSFDLAGAERPRSFRRFGGLAGDSEASVATVARQGRDGT